MQICDWLLWNTILQFSVVVKRPCHLAYADQSDSISAKHSQPPYTLLSSTSLAFFPPFCSWQWKGAIMCLPWSSNSTWAWQHSARPRHDQGRADHMFLHTWKCQVFSPVVEEKGPPREHRDYLVTTSVRSFGQGDCRLSCMAHITGSLLNLILTCMTIL